MNYIGVDCHISTLDFAVVTETGRVKNKTRVKTSAKEFMGFIKSVPKPRRIFIEEGTYTVILKSTRDMYPDGFFDLHGYPEINGYREAIKRGDNIPGPIEESIEQYGDPELAIWQDFEAADEDPKWAEPWEELLEKYYERAELQAVQDENYKIKGWILKNKP